MHWFKPLAAMGAAAAISFAAPAMADPAPLFGNTLRLQLPDGSAVNFYINPDGTYSEVHPDGVTLSGVWTETATQMCYTQTAPTPVEQACDPKITHVVGDVWPISGANGQTEQFSIIAGR